MHRIASALLIICAVSMTAAAWSQAVGNDTPAVHIVKMVDVSDTSYLFEPSEITVKPGDTVRFEQTSSTPHNVEFREMPEGSSPGDQMMGPYLDTPGDTYDVVIDDRFVAGEHNFVCTPHEFFGMIGKIIVGGE